MQLYGAATLREIQQRVSAWAEARPDAAWVTGGGWGYDVFADLPTRAQLDAAVSRRPVRLLSEDGEALWVNSRALRLAGITRRTPDPLNGAIVRDRRGEPTGLLRGAAMRLVNRLVPEPTREERAKALQFAIRQAQRLGVTSVQDVGAGAGDLDLYDQARTAGTLGIRVYASVPADRTAPDDLDAIARRYPDDPLLKTGLATIDLDGSLESQTAAMLAPYSPKATDGGSLRMTVDDLTRLVTTLTERRWQVAAGAAGDRAVRVALDAFGASTRSATGVKSPRHRIEGAAIVDPQDVPRFGALGVIASMQPLHASAGGSLSWARGLGAERAPLAWPSRSLSAAGAHLAFGSDWPNLPLDPLETLRAVVARPDLRALAAIDAEVGDQRVDVWRGVGVVRRAPQGHARSRHARRPRHPLDRHLRRPREARRGRGRHDDLQRQGRLQARVVIIRGASPLGLPYTRSRSRCGARLRSRGSFAAAHSHFRASPLGLPYTRSRSRWALASVRVARSLPLTRIFGLRPSDSPTRALARAAALASFAWLVRCRSSPPYTRSRSRGARLRSRGSFAPLTRRGVRSEQQVRESLRIRSVMSTHDAVLDEASTSLVNPSSGTLSASPRPNHEHDASSTSSLVTRRAAFREQFLAAHEQTDTLTPQLGENRQVRIVHAVLRPVVRIVQHRIVGGRGMKDDHEVHVRALDAMRGERVQLAAGHVHGRVELVGLLRAPAGFEHHAVDVGVVGEERRAR